MLVIYIFNMHSVSGALSRTAFPDPSMHGKATRSSPPPISQILAEFRVETLRTPVLHKTSQEMSG